jgi:hypothetical protein
VTSGKVTSICAQIQGLKFADEKDYLDAEVLVTLDSAPEMRFGYDYHDNAVLSQSLTAY